MTEEMRIICRTATTAPDYSKTAAELLARCREFYQDPENERAFQEWKAGRKAKTEKIR